MVFPADKKAAGANGQCQDQRSPQRLNPKD
jgi:hypothetical protein